MVRAPLHCGNTIALQGRECTVSTTHHVAVVVSTRSFLVARARLRRRPVERWLAPSAAGSGMRSPFDWCCSNVRTAQLLFSRQWKTPCDGSSLRLLHILRQRSDVVFHRTVVLQIRVIVARWSSPQETARIASSPWGWYSPAVSDDSGLAHLHSGSVVVDKTLLSRAGATASEWKIVRRPTDAPGWGVVAC